MASRQMEHLAVTEEFNAPELQAFFSNSCQRYLGWAQQEAAHRAQRDAALEALAFPQCRFAPASARWRPAYRACVQSRLLLAGAHRHWQNAGHTVPRAQGHAVRGTDKLFYPTARTPGRQIALDALGQPCGASPAGLPCGCWNWQAKDKAREHKDKACHGQSCLLASGFYDRLPAAREAAAWAQWLDQAAPSATLREHQVCLLPGGYDMAHWADVVVGDYNYYFDRLAMLYALTVESAWRERAGGRGAQPLRAGPALCTAPTTQAEALALRPRRVLASSAPARTSCSTSGNCCWTRQRQAPGKPRHVLDALLEEWTRVLGKVQQRGR
ncbi:MAG: hypothetical protein U1E71_06665 [Ramlibacter sp.]